MKYSSERKADAYLFTTRRCGIRELTEADLPAEFELYRGPHMTEHIPPLSGYKEELKLFREYAGLVYRVYGYGMWGIFDPVTGRLMGEAGLEPRVDVNRAKYPYDWMFGEHSAELGFLIAEELWGQGYCKEACRGVLQYCGEHFGIDTVFARTVPENIAAVRVLAGLGFEEYSRIPAENGEGMMIIFAAGLGAGPGDGS